MRRESNRDNLLSALLALVVVLAGAMAPAPSWMRVGPAAAQAAPPANNNLASATSVSVPGSLVGSNVGATVEVGEPLYPGDNSMGPYNQCYIIPGQVYTSTVWVRATIPSSGVLTVSTANAGTTIDSALAVYRLTSPTAGAVYGNLTLLGCDNNGDALFPPGGTVPTWSSKLRVTVPAGDVYIQIAGIGGAPQGGYELTLQHQPDVFLADLGAASFESSFNLLGWGSAQWHESSPANPYTAPSGDRSKRNHSTPTGDATLSFSNLANHGYRLTAEVEDGFGNDSFSILANGSSLLTYADNTSDNELQQTVVVRAHTAVVPASLVSQGEGSLTVSFRNTLGSEFTNPAVYNVQLAPLARVAYIYATDTGSRDAFAAYLQGRGYQADLVVLGNVATYDFTPDQAIIVGDDTGSLSSWGTQAAVDQIKRTNKPVLGVGEGGYAFFGRLALAIGWGNGWHAGPQTGAIVVDAASSIWSTPNAVPATTGGTVGLYTTGSPFVAIFNPTPVAGVTRIARQTDDASHYPLISQGGCYLLWGFSNSPATMTQAGRDLFENALQLPACGASSATVSGIAQCGDSGLLVGARVDLFSGTSLVASTTADPVTAAYAFFVAPGDYTVRITKGAIVCGGPRRHPGDAAYRSAQPLLARGVPGEHARASRCSSCGRRAHLQAGPVRLVQIHGSTWRKGHRHAHRAPRELRLDPL